MRRQTFSNTQIRSLQRKPQVVEEIIDRISNLKEEQVKAIVPSMDDRDVSKLKERSIKRLLSDQPPTGTNGIEEAIILKFGRPVFLIKNSLPLLTGEEVDQWKEGIEKGIKQLALKDSITSVGRIEVINYPGYTYMGTGWLATDEYIITNQHVAERFFIQQNGVYTFRSFRGMYVRSNVDFLAEYENEDFAEFEIEKCIYMGTSTELDLAILKVKWNTTSRLFKPLNLSKVHPRKGEDFVSVGYPAFDSRAALVTDMERIFGGIYDVKRLAPGEITEVWEKEFLSSHDATTLGGASGSALISLETGKVIGLHYAGKEEVANYCVSAPYIKKVIDQLPKRYFSILANGAPDPAIVAELKPRHCDLVPYTKIKVPDFKVTGRIICYASPDSTYAVTKRLFDSANESILIGIYDLSAQYMVELIIQTAERGVSVSLMLDINSKEEKEIFDRLKQYRMEAVSAPSCANDNISYFASSHEKVIVIDQKWTLIQSGNYSIRSIPLNEVDGDQSENFRTGNRDMGIAIESRYLAEFFSGVLRSDMNLEKNASGNLSVVLPRYSLDFLVEAPPEKPPQVFSSKQFNLQNSVRIQAVLSPDNYIDIIPDYLAGARKNIKIQQQYIKADQPLIKKLLESIPKNIEVQIILARPMSKGEKFNQEVLSMQNLASTYGFEVRILSPRHFTHCHNKLIIVDDERVLISSQNWSDFAVSKNREAGVIVYNDEITKYYSQIFMADWTISEEPITNIEQPVFESNTENFASKTKFVRLNVADIQEV